LPHTSRPFTDGLEYFTLTVDIPIVCETDAAGLGVLGVVIPWAMQSNDATTDKNITSFLIKNVCFIQLYFR
jgi:hypothetical protein